MHSVCVLSGRWPFYMSSNHTGNVQPAIDREEHFHPFGDTNFGAKMVIEPFPAGSFTQKRLDYDVRTDDNPVYVGFNVREKGTSDERWIIQKLTYDGSDRVTLIQIAIDSWDNRSTATYS